MTYDLVKFIWNAKLKAFQKLSTIETNVSKGFAYYRKITLSSHPTIKTPIRYMVVENGSYKDTLQFKHK